MPNNDSSTGTAETIAIKAIERRQKKIVYKKKKKKKKEEHKGRQDEYVEYCFYWDAIPLTTVTSFIMTIVTQVQSDKI